MGITPRGLIHLSQRNGWRQFGSSAEDRWRWTEMDREERWRGREETSAAKTNNGKGVKKIEFKC